MTRGSTGVSTRAVDDRVKAMGGTGISKSQVSRLCEGIDGKVKAFLDRPIEGDWPDLWIEAALCEGARQSRIVSAAVIVAVGVNSKGIEAAAAKIMHATWRRCRVPFLRNAPAHAGKSGRRGVSAFIATAFAQDEAPSASAPWRPKLPKRATPMDEAEPDVLAYMSLPAAHRTKLHARIRSGASTARSSGEPKSSPSFPMRFPNEAAIVRRVGAILLEQNDERPLQRARYMTLETIAPLSDEPIVGLPAVAA